MNRADFSIVIEFNDGTVVTLGGSDEFFVRPDVGSESGNLDDERLNLIRLVREAERLATEGVA